LCLLGNLWSPMNIYDKKHRDFCWLYVNSHMIKIRDCLYPIVVRSGYLEDFDLQEIAGLYVVIHQELSGA